MKRRSIRTILRRAFLFLAAVTLILLSAIFSVFQYQTLKSQAVRDIQESCYSAADRLNQEIKGMDTILLYAIASSELKEHFLDYLGAESSFERYQSRQKLAGTLISLKGFDFFIRQFNIYAFDGGGYGVGNYSGDLTANARDQSWYDRAVAAGGRKVFTAPDIDPLISSSAGVDKETPYFTLCRMFYNDMHIPLGFLEVKVYYHEIFDFKTDNLVVVYDENRDQLYPNTPAYPFYPVYLGEQDSAGGWYLAFAEEEADRLVLAMAVENREFLAPVYRSLLPIIAVAFLIFLVSVMLAVSLSRRLSDPIRQVYHFLSAPEEEGRRIELKDNEVLEIEKLKNSLNESMEARENATKTMLILKEQEMQSQMLALQSQMNPHFLYNSLSAIGEMADSGMVDQVSDMCADITSILRYISSNEKMRIRVEEEMEQVDRYLSCMKRRYGEELQYRYEISDEILDCLVPKLCIQLLVENAIKAMTTKSAPWIVTVEGGRKKTEGAQTDDWYVTVKDNGPGFDPEVDRSLREHMNEILNTGTLPSLQIEGMGILNIFIRLFLIDGIPFVFDFGNRREGGAFVTVGGHIHAED